VLAQAGEEGEGVIVADLDFQRQDEVRATLPALANRRPGVYHWPEEARV
jgi:deaminated glutathione amidase